MISSLVVLLVPFLSAKTWSSLCSLFIVEEFCPLFFTEFLQFIEIYWHSYMHSSLKVPPEHFNQVAVCVWTLNVKKALFYCCDTLIFNFKQKKKKGCKSSLGSQNRFHGAPWEWIHFIWYLKESALELFFFLCHPIPGAPQRNPV